MKTSVILALFGFVLAVGFSVALTENELAEIADEFEEEKLRGEYDMKENDGEFDEEDLEDNDMAIPRSEVAAEDEEFDERAFDNDDDRDEVSDEGDVTAIEKSADPFIRFRRIGRKIGRRIRRPVRPRIRRAIRRGRRIFRRFRG
ncbi:unnamed protein product [Pocillopora meandrina]|uniref:Uncharacterized protein n=1 Tax=Pocillopora meandrina TaxID=46732 RepID=A0AAU9WXR5_9CNID|nr:unnamed protein product [Pocillopora meandrina]